VQGTKYAHVNCAAGKYPDGHRPYMNSKIGRIIVALTVIGVFVFDLMHPLGHLEWIIHLLPFLLSLRFVNPAYVPHIASVFTFIIILNIFLSPSGGVPPDVAFSNRMFGIVVIWLITYLVLYRLRTEKHIQESERTLKAVNNSSLDAIFVIDGKGVISYLNSAAETLFGYTREEATGRQLHTFLVSETARQEYYERLPLFEKSGECKVIGKTLNLNATKKDGTRIPVELAVTSFKIGKAWHASGVVRDISQRMQLEAELIKTKEEFERFFTEIPSLSCIVTMDNYFKKLNPAWESALGYTIEEMLSRPFTEFIHPEDLKATSAKVEEQEMGFAVLNFTNRYRCRDGSYRWLEWRTSTDKENRLVYAVANDITERKKMDEVIRHQAYHDPLTNLPNRRLFKDILTIELALAKRSRKRLAVLFLDLDKFKYVNDTMGHDAGDELLREVGSRLKHSIRESDTIARIGGDEFNILLNDLARNEDVVTISKKILESFEPPVTISGRYLQVTTSIGISIYPDDARNTEALFRNADVAMYHAKELGGNKYQLYDPSLNSRLNNRLRLESRLRRSLDQGELEVYYQPQFILKTRQLVCAEALVRWRHPDQGMLDAENFIRLAEETGLVSDIDEWVLKTACAQSRSWQHDGLPCICVTVNLSDKEFRKPDFVERIRQTLEETGLNPHCLHLEITESTAMKDIERTVSIGNRLAGMGIGISIDHFGLGYLPLRDLKRLPVQKLKIDRSFIKDIAGDNDGRETISALIAMAHTMKFKVLAEGVETEEQLSFLLENLCDEAQGYFFYKPLPPEEFAGMIAAGSMD
jgi:diguanylate cyclase (GGDEF)-like protein/PAS domain S-box-containing protein